MDEYQGQKSDLPEGLDNLMADITREVLRAQPENIHGFIAQYLGALLKARIALSIAADVTKCTCATAGATDLDNRIQEHNTHEEDTHLSHESSESSGTYYNAKKLNHSIGIETNKYDVARQRRRTDFWSRSVFSLAGSYMNLPASRPYSVYDNDVIEDPKQVVEKLQYHHQIHRSYSSHYELKNICTIVPQIESDDEYSDKPLPDDDSVQHIESHENVRFVTSDDSV